MADFQVSKDENRRLLGIVEPGRYFVEVKRSEFKHSRTKGDPMFEIDLHEVGSGRFIVKDRLMLGGRGYGMGKKRLEVLGAIPRGCEDFEVNASALVGLRGFVHTMIEEYQGQQQVKINTDEGEIGYEPSSAPKGDDEAAIKDSGDVPF